MFRPSLRFALVTLGAVLAASPALATPLESGTNSGTADSFAGTQHWTIDAKPGPLEIDVMLGQVPPNALDGAPFTVVLNVLPHSQKSHFTFKRVPGGYVFGGRPTALTHLVLDVVPAHSSLVRQALAYTVTASGNLVYGKPAGGDAIVGTYTATTQGIGAAKFLPGGKLVTTQGGDGSWTLFDAATHVYSVTLGQNRWTLKLMPGQGLLDANNGNIEFQVVH